MPLSVPVDQGPLRSGDLFRLNHNVTSRAKETSVTLSMQEISDRLEIEQLLVRYCHAIDQRDWDAYRAVYTEDAVIDDVSAGHGNSVDQMVEFLTRALEGVVLIQHAVSTMLLEVDGDTANARTVCHCPVVVGVGGGETQMIFQGLWYEDELVRTPDGWRISKRAETDYFTQNAPPGFGFE
jgi:ketosteroid isomerase-like protein